MSSRRRKAAREKDLTSRYLSGKLEEDRLDSVERFGDKSRQVRESKLQQTAQMRAASDAGDVESLPIGYVVQVFSLYVEVEYEQRTYLCTQRKTMTRVGDTAVVVGDWVRFRATGTVNEAGQPEAAIEQILPRKTVVTRADSFKGITQRPVVANAQQMLIVASVRQPRVKWQLVDRMLIAAQSGGLVPIICLNKIDLAHHDQAGDELDAVEAAMAHYASMGVVTLMTSVPLDRGLGTLRDWLGQRTTVLAGHSGVGKSSLIRAIQPQLDLRIGVISRYNEKGRHTTTSSRYYPLDFGGAVIDTPGVRQFGLWRIAPEDLQRYYPDVVGGGAPPWRVDSYHHVLESIGGEVPGDEAGGDETSEDEASQELE